MSRVNGVIPSLMNGVSQQSPAFRLTTQGEIQDNATPSIVDGTSKRQPTKHKAVISRSSMKNAFMHDINRDLTEQYQVIVQNGHLQVFDLKDGTEKVVNFPEGKAYLAAASPKDAFRMVTVADYTFIVNRNVAVRMDPYEALETERNEAVAYVKKGVINTSYKVMVNGTWASYTTPEASSTTSTMSSGIDDSAVIEPWDWNFTTCYNWLKANGRPVPHEYDVYNWSHADFAAYAGITNPSGDDMAYYRQVMINAYLDLSDAELIAAAGESWNQTPAAQHMYQSILNFKARLRSYTRNQSAAMVAAGLKSAVSTVVNTGTQPSTEEIAKTLMGILKTILPQNVWEIDTFGSSLRVRRYDNQDFQFAVTDSWGNEALMGIKREVAKFTDLPARCWDGFRVKVTGENLSSADDYYVEYQSDNYHKNGIWQEVCGWNQRNRFDASTMPHTLIREANDTFTFESGPWKRRYCGDDDSAPIPTFVGRCISDAMFFRSRLGFLVDENIVLSATGEFFNFWPESVTRNEVTDPIDYAINHDGVAMLRHATEFEDTLIMCADQVQFQFGDGNTGGLAPDTAIAKPTTRLDCSASCKPVAAGRALYFIAENGEYSRMHEYYVASDSVTSVAPEVTAHVPTYLPKNIFKMTAALNDGMIFMLSSETPNIIYMYRYYWAGDDKIQSAWFRWILAEGSTVLSITSIQSTMYLLVERADGVTLETIELNSFEESPFIGYPVMLDRKVTVRGVYNAAADITTWTLPYPATDPDFSAVFGLDAPDGMRGDLLRPFTVQGNMISKTGQHDYSIIAGVNYLMWYRFSPQFYRESRENGASVIREGRLQLLRFKVAFQDSGYFKSRVQSFGREPLETEFLGVLDSHEHQFGKPNIQSGEFTFLVRARADRVHIDILNPYHYPSTFQSAEWVGTFDSDARRI